MQSKILVAPFYQHGLSSFSYICKLLPHTHLRLFQGLGSCRSVRHKKPETEERKTIRDSNAISHFNRYKLQHHSRTHIKWYSTDSTQREKGFRRGQRGHRLCFALPDYKDDDGAAFATAAAAAGPWNFMIYEWVLADMRYDGWHGEEGSRSWSKAFALFLAPFFLWLPSSKIVALFVESTESTAGLGRCAGLAIW